MTSDPRLLANAIRALAMDAVQAANSGHPGMPMGMADAATILCTEYFKHDPLDPSWPDRDRFVLSAGHGSMLIYALLHLTGYERPTIEDIRNFRKVGSPCAGHPENFMLEGVECTTGPLGQGVAMAVGMAIAERHLNAVFGGNLVDHRTWVIAGDGCLMEGVNHEAAGLAGHLKLGRLNVIWDDNRITIDGATDLSTSEDIEARYRAYGWHVVRCDGHDFASIRAAYDEALGDPRPSMIACRTIIGWGAPNKQGTSATHGAALGDEEVAAARKQLVWDAEPFDLPEEIASAWREAGKRAQGDHVAWNERLKASPHSGEFMRRMRGDLPEGEAIGRKLQELCAGGGKVATRKASEAVLNVLAEGIPELIGGSADLTGSNNTKAESQAPLTAENHGGRYIYYGIREFGMAAAMNGMALHGGVIPYGGTFLVFADYCRPAIRLSALQNARVVYVMTHDSIGLGEDGPTHQPIEHLQSLRAMPNLRVFRPADLTETAECWQLALERRDGPSLLALTRQNLPAIRNGGEQLSARGAYRLRAAAAERKVILLATGSEVEIALAVSKRLEGQGIGTDVVSMPCAELFDAQDDAYRGDILPDVSNRLILRASIEAGSTIGWERYTGLHGLRFGIDRFGASGPAEDLYEKFGLTAEAITPQIMNKLEQYAAERAAQ
jgi:transketolase